jgi:hypothetical protein
MSCVWLSYGKKRNIGISNHDYDKESLKNTYSTERQFIKQ